MRRILFSFVMMLTCAILSAQSSATLYSSLGKVNPGEKFTVSIKMQNTDNITCFSFYFGLPDGFSIAEVWDDEEEDYLQQISFSRHNTTKKNGHYTDVQETATGETMISVYHHASVFSGTDGEVVSVTVECDASVAPGDYNVAISHISFADTDFNGIEQDDFNIPFTVTPAYATVNLNSESFATYSSQSNAAIATPGVKAYKAAVEGSQIILTELNGYIPAGTAVLLHGEELAAGTKVEFDEPAAGVPASDMSGNSLMATTNSDGVLADMPSSGFTFALGDENKFLHYTGTAFIHNRAYLWFDTDPVPANAKALNLAFANDNATGINVMNDSADVSRKLYENGKVVIVNNSKKYSVSGQIIK